MSAGGATNGTVGVISRSNPSSAASTRSRYSSRSRAAAADLGVLHLETALDLAAHVLAVELLVAGEEGTMDVSRFAHEVGAIPGCERDIEIAAAREVIRRFRHAPPHERLSSVEPRDPDREL